MRRSSVTRPALFFAAAYTLLGGAVHLDQWLNGYRRIPSAVPGAWVVRLGFPMQALTSGVLALALVVVALRLPRLAVPAIAASVGFQLSTLGLIIATRMGSVFGWSEPVWTPGANLARAAAIGALVMLGLSMVMGRRAPRRSALVEVAVR